MGKDAKIWKICSPVSLFGHSDPSSLYHGNTHADVVWFATETKVPCIANTIKHTMRSEHESVVIGKWGPRI